MIDEKRLENIEQNQQQILDTLTQLKMAVCGSEKIGVEGLVPKVVRHEKYIESDKKFKWMFAGAVTLITAILFIWEKIK
jgi:hypothetical protein